MSGPPQAALASANRSERAYRVAAKLRPGVTAKAAQASLDVVTEHLTGLYAEDQEYGAVVIPCAKEWPATSVPVIALSGALGFALLLLCINVSYLRSVHLEARRKEFALRVALGAGRLILIRQLLMDTLLLFGIGTGIGIWLSPSGVHLLLASIPAREIP
jgi:putative ABC transport system permease protein